MVCTGEFNTVPGKLITRIKELIRVFQAFLLVLAGDRGLIKLCTPYAAPLRDGWAGA